MVAEELKESSPDIGILEQNFKQLPAERRFLLKDYLQNLVSMQNTMIGADAGDKVWTSSSKEQGGY